jgi:hypothetical protein
MATNILVDSLAMAQGITYERKVGIVMNWALFATWTRKE